MAEETERVGALDGGPLAAPPPAGGDPDELGRRRRRRWRRCSGDEVVC
jgi:hypothetical protein